MTTMKKLILVIIVTFPTVVGVGQTVKLPDANQDRPLALRTNLSLVITPVNEWTVDGLVTAAAKSLNQYWGNYFKAMGKAYRPPNIARSSEPIKNALYIPLSNSIIYDHN